MTLDRTPRPRRLGRIAALPVFLALAGSLLASGAAAAGNNGATVIRGVQQAAGTCEDGGFLMTGDLTGCWWIETFETKSDPNKANLLAKGTERFTGCLFGSICGTFYTTYVFTAKFDGPWPTSNEVLGRCHHPITLGTGDFAGVRGQLSFHDVVDVSPPYYPYVGTIQLDAPGRTAAAPSGPRSGGASSVEASSC